MVQCWYLQKLEFARNILEHIPMVRFFPKLYNFAKKHHFDFIDALLNRKESVESNLTNSQIKVVNAVIDFFGKYTAGELVAWSQHPNGAWFKSSSMSKISDDLIIEYFKTLIKKV